MKTHEWSPMEALLVECKNCGEKFSHEFSDNPEEAGECSAEKHVLGKLTPQTPPEGSISLTGARTKVVITDRRGNVNPLSGMIDHMTEETKLVDSYHTGKPAPLTWLTLSSFVSNKMHQEPLYVGEEYSVQILSKEPVSGQYTVLSERQYVVIKATRKTAVREMTKQETLLVEATK